MKNRKINQQITAIQNRVANKGNTQKLHLSITVGKRVVCYRAITPPTHAEYLRLKSNRHTVDDNLNAISATLQNSSEGLYCELSVDGRMIAYDLGKFGREINYGWLRINNHPVDKICTPEGLTALLAAEFLK